MPTRAEKKPSSSGNTQRIPGVGVVLFLMCLFVVAVVLAVYVTAANRDAGDSLKRGLGEVTLSLFAMLCMATMLPGLALCLSVSAIRGVQTGRFAVAGVSRKESPVAFSYVVAIYIVLALGALTGMAMLMRKMLS